MDTGKTKGLIHLYCGDGKGKTTAAVGLAVRMAGAGKQVVFSQFFKDGSSSEIRALQKLGVRVMNCETVSGWFSRMTPEEKNKVREDYSRFLEEVFEAAKQADLLVLDEVIFACGNNTIRESRLTELLKDRPEGLEVVLTGRNPSESLVDTADYVTQMAKQKHPYDKGISARHGIEF